MQLLQYCVGESLWFNQSELIIRRVDARKTKIIKILLPRINHQKSLHHFYKKIAFHDSDLPCKWNKYQIEKEGISFWANFGFVWLSRIYENITTYSLDNFAYFMWPTSKFKTEIGEYIIQPFDDLKSYN